jgi:hypothetical protein
VSEPRDPCVIRKERDGGTHHGKVTFYAVGWQRSTRSAAREDLERFLREDAREVDQVIASAIRSGGSGKIEQLQGQIAGLRGALETAREAIASLPEDALGQGRSIINDRQTGEPSELVWSIRDELVDAITKALATDAGEREAAVLRAAIGMAAATEHWLEWDNDAQVGLCIPCGMHAERPEDISHDEGCPIAVFVAYRDALRGGEK